MPAADAAEVQGRADAIAAEANVSGVIGHSLARIAALNSVRIERGADEATAARLREEAIRRAMFDPSKDAVMTRQYQAAAERGFLRALTELR